MSDVSGRRVLVTGGAGFLGSHVVDLLRERGAELIVPRSAEFDLVVEDDVQRLVGETRPEMVMHLAARVGGIGANQRNPGAYFYANLMMGALLMEHSRRTGVEKFLQLGTICAYPKFTPVPFHEDDLWDGYPEETNAPYGVAKKALLVQAQAYREQYGFNAIYLLPVNLYGPKDNFDRESSHVIPALIRKMIEAQESGDAKVVLWGDGSPSREFLYVDDCAEALVLALERYDRPEPVNVGAGFEITIRDLAELVREITGFGGEIEWDTSRPGGQPRRMLDTSRAEREFGFKAQTGFREGLQKTVDWFREHRDWVAEDERRRRESERRAMAAAGLLTGSP
ncbi:MAG: GDP-L-fucose synthase family protein [Thermoleophilaceae bacterium]